MMIEKIKNTIINTAEDKALNIEKKDIEQRLYVLGKDVNGGSYYGRAGKKRFLHHVQKRNRVPFTEEEHCKNDKG